MNLSKQITSLFSLLLFFPLLVMAAEGEARLDRFSKGLVSLEANFTQTVYNSRLEEVQSTRGLFQMKRPSRFRWDYQQPYEQQIVADGKKLWVYDVDLEQVTVKKLDTAMGNTPALLLSNPALLTKSFHIHERGEESGLVWLELEAKQQDHTFEHLRLGFDGDSLRVMELVDSFGQMTRLAFSAVIRNPRLTDQDFEFSPPKGVDVVGEQ